jgi:formate--tetrahydrofolate ligase
MVKEVCKKTIQELATDLGVPNDKLIPFGHYKAKLNLELIDQQKIDNSNLILVTAMSPTPEGIGKTTMSIGLSDAINLEGKKSIVALREPSLGPIFGRKGGATGGGKVKVEPGININLHFNGDFAAIEKANNLLASFIDHEIHFLGLKDRIDSRTINWKRAIDCNDRFLRNVVTGLGGQKGGVPSQTGFIITAASEIMAILCMSQSISDLKKRLGIILIGESFSHRPVFARDLKVVDSLTLLLLEALLPNLVQTNLGYPAIIHGGPFANIAQGTNSILGTKMAQSLCEYVVTEAGFGADLGAEKFFNIKCREGGLKPKVIVITVTLKALKYQGIENLLRHFKNCRKFDLPVVVALNKHSDDSDKELESFSDLCKEKEIPMAIADIFNEGAKGAKDLAQMVIEKAGHKNQFTPSYEIDWDPVKKIKTLAENLYGASKVNFSSKALRKIEKFQAYDNSPSYICMAKTPYSFTDDPKKLGAPLDFEFLIKNVDVAMGAGFLIPLAGDVLRMPALPKQANAFQIQVSNEGAISGLH